MPENIGIFKISDILISSLEQTPGTINAAYPRINDLIRFKALGE